MSKYQEDIMNQEQTKEIKTMDKEQVDKLKEEFENKGYCQIKNFFNFSEIETIQETLEKAKNESNVSKEKVTLKVAKNDYIDTTDHAYDLVKYDFVSSLIKKKLPFLNYISGKKIMIMHNALFSVEPNQTGLPWHVGVGSFSFTKTEDFGASIWIPLDKITKEYRGGMQYVSTKIFPGQFYYTISDLHLRNNINWDESKGDLNEYVANANTILNKITGDVIDYTIQDGYQEHEYDVGDVLFFNKYVLHRSVSLKPGLHKLRRAFVIRFVDYDTRVDEERLGLFSKYSQLHSRVYKTLPRYNKDSVLVMVSRSIQQGLKSPYLRDIPYVKKTLSERIAVESENFEQTLNRSPSNSLNADIAVESENLEQTLSRSPSDSLNADIAVESENLEQTLNRSPSDSLNADIAQIKETLKNSLAETLYADITEIQEDQNFLELGLDSIVGVEWTNTINHTYGLEIKASKLYDVPTLLELAEYIAEEISHKNQKLSTSLNDDYGKEPSIINHSSSVNDDYGKEPSIINHSSVNLQENYRKNLRSILNQVANNELTIQAANQMIQELKQNSKSQDELMTKNKMFELLKKFTREVVPKLKEEPIEITDSLKNLGIDSVNRAEIIMMVMEELDLHIPLIELAPARNIGEIADLFAAKLEAHHGI